MEQRKTAQGGPGRQGQTRSAGRDTTRVPGRDPAAFPCHLLCTLIMVFLLAAVPPRVMAQAKFPDNGDISLATFNYPGRYIRHRNFLGEVTAIHTELDQQDATFRVVPGLAAEGEVSLESVNYPGFYLRHQNYRLKLQSMAGDPNPDLFRADATFRVVQGLADKEGISLEAHNFPGFYIRHRNFHLYLDRNDHTQLFREDATFWTRLPFWIPAWTVLVYIDGDNNLEPYALNDYREMARIGSSADLNIVVQMDRVGGHSSEDGDWTDTRRFLVTRDHAADAPAVAELGEVNMGEMESLRDFAQWGVSHYPARHYLLVIWNHGAGWRAVPRPKTAGGTEGPGRASPGALGTVALDDTDNDVLYMREVQDALQEAAANLSDHGRPFRFDMVGFDACLMDMLEVAYALRNVTDTMVASEYCEPADGWPYDTILEQLAKQPTMSAARLGGLIVEKYYLSYGGSSSWGITLAALDMAKLPEVVSALDRFAATATRRWARLRRARGSATVYHGLTEGNCCAGGPSCWGVDIKNFADLVRARTSPRSPIHHVASRLGAAVDSLVIKEAHSDNLAGSHGVAFYFPRTRKIFDKDPESSGYTQDNTFMAVDFVRDHGWDEWLDRFYDHEQEEDYTCAMDSDCPGNRKCCEPWPLGRGICVPAGAHCP